MTMLIKIHLLLSSTRMHKSKIFIKKRGKMGKLDKIWTSVEKDQDWFISYSKCAIAV